MTSARKRTPRQSRPTTSTPGLGDHWHAAYGVYDCDEFLPALTDVQADTSGIHTHGEGLMHIHPFSSVYLGFSDTSSDSFSDPFSDFSDEFSDFSDQFGD